jgi:hypothetical protein
MDELLKKHGLDFTGLTTTPGRGRNPVTEHCFLMRAADVEQAGNLVRAAIDGTGLRLMAVVFVSDECFECTVLGSYDPHG